MRNNKGKKGFNPKGNHLGEKLVNDVVEHDQEELL
jgi:hypothetical protein